MRKKVVYLSGRERVSPLEELVLRWIATFAMREGRLPTTTELTAGASAATADGYRKAVKMLTGKGWIKRSADGRAIVGVKGIKIALSIDRATDDGMKLTAVMHGLHREKGHRALARDRAREEREGESHE